MAPRRPNAFEVSFPEEAKTFNSATLPESRPGSLKRKGEALESDDSREVKRQLPPVAFYEERDGAERESANLVITGEDPFDGEDADGNEVEKPIRVLADFSIFDPLHRNEMIPLNVIEEDDGVDRKFEGAGVVFPYFANEEDEGQEDDELDPELKYVHLGAILRYTFDYTQESDPVYIETEFAWYILKIPSRAYSPYFEHFYTPRRVAQLVISSAVARPNKSYEEFLQRFVSMVDSFGHTYQEGHLLDAVPEIRGAIEDQRDPGQLRSTPLVRHILRKAGPSSSARPLPAQREGVVRNRNPPPIKSFLGNPDLAVLKSENQNPTHVTPSIAALARGLVFEELIVVGGRPPPPNKALEEAQKKAAHARLRDLVSMAKRRKKLVDINRGDYIGPHTRYLKAVKIDHETYRMGDFVIVPIGHDRERGELPPGLPDDVNDIPPTSTIANYFWFAKILYGDVDRGQFHVQWLEHASHTMLQEMGNAQELFYNDLCGHIDFRTVVSKVAVHEHPKSAIDPEDYFVKFYYNKKMATYTSIDMERQHLAVNRLPPDNCVVCPLHEQQFEEQRDRQLKNSQGVIDGVAYGGNKYHYEDFVLYKATSGPANIGYITGINFPLRETSAVSTTLNVRCVGRISSIAHVLPPDVLKDERHVFLTNQKAIIRVQDLIRVCFVFPYGSITDPKDDWLSMSPDHFYIRYTFPTLNVKLWSDRKKLSCKDLPVCTSCVADALKERKNMLEFLTYSKRNPILTLDLFGGVAAFSMGLVQGSGCLKITDSIEKSPSAAKTTMRNFPGITVHNQCTNIMMRYTIKAKEGHHPDVPKQLFDGKTAVPGPIKAAKCVIAGFPCQSHSRLNMFRKADDIKSNLILNALSWVDHIKPDLCYFENVPGFLSFSFDAVQFDIYKVVGGSPMGGLKFLVRALTDMSYQVRFGLLQAAHYGTPQRRNRFFLIAALDGHPLPELPQPSHDFDTRGLVINMPIGGLPIRPIRTDRGTAPHPSVTIDDAISDLPRFDWKHPNPRRQSAAKQRESREREKKIPALPCKYSSPYCGFQGRIGYYHAPKTSYQLAARAKPTTDLQHFTRCLLPQKVERFVYLTHLPPAIDVISVPLIASADYRNLRPDQQEWQMANPLSSVARQNYRPGLYGRLNKNECFPTTVTNMDPTAKQSRVLNPYCKRMVTVRELARSQGFPDHFVFESIGNNVVTMHRQIGNAVPIPIGVALGRELRIALYKKWLNTRQDAILIDD